MKAKITKGNTFTGALRYALDKKKGAEIVFSNMLGQTPRELANEFEDTTSMRDIKRPVYHMSLSQPPGKENRLTDNQWDAIARSQLIKMGFEPDKTPYIVIRHKDRNHDHVHIILSRVNFAGKVWDDYHDVYKAIQATQEIEREYQLTRTKGYGESKPSNRKRPTRAEQEAAKRRAKKGITESDIPPRVRLQDLVDAALKQNKSISARAFAFWLENHGVTVKANIAKTGKMNGFSYELDGIHFKSSQLGKKYTYESLKERGLTFDDKEDTSAFVQGKLTETAKESLITPTKKKKKKKKSPSPGQIGAKPQAQEHLDASMPPPEETGATQAQERLDASMTPPEETGATQAQERLDASMTPDKTEAKQAELPAPATTVTTPQQAFPPSSPGDETIQDVRIREYRARLQDEPWTENAIFEEILNAVNLVNEQALTPAYRRHPLEQEGYKIKLLALADEYGRKEEIECSSAKHLQVITAHLTTSGQTPVSLNKAEQPNPEKSRGRSR